MKMLGSFPAGLGQVSPSSMWLGQAISLSFKASLNLAPDADQDSHFSCAREE